MLQFHYQVDLMVKPFPEHHGAEGTENADKCSTFGSSLDESMAINNVLNL